MPENTEIVPRTTDDWLAEQTGVNMFKTPDGRTCISFDPGFASRFNFLTPVSQVLQLDPNWRPVPRILQLNPAVHAYQRKGTWDLSKQGLGALAELAGIERDGVPERDHMDGTGISVTVKARQRRSDGTWRHGAGSITVIFSRAEAKIRRENAGKHDADIEKRVDEFYDTIHAKAETRAWLRAIREMLALPGQFSKQELNKPFFVLGYVFTPDWSNPQIARLLDLQFGQGVRELYGEPPALEVVSTPATARQIPPPSPEGDFDADVDDDEGWGESTDAGYEERILDAETAAGEITEADNAFAEPAQGFTPVRGPFEGKHVKEIITTAEGRVWLAAAVSHMEDEDKRAQGLAWLSFALQRQIGLADLDSVA